MGYSSQSILAEEHGKTNSQKVMKMRIRSLLPVFLLLFAILNSCRWQEGKFRKLGGEILKDSDGSFHIDFNNISFGEDHFEAVNSVSDVKSLELNACNLTDDDIDLFRSNNVLEVLVISRNEFSDKAIKRICVLFPNLKVLDIRYCEYISDLSVQYLTSLDKLEKVKLNGNKFTLKGVDRLRRTIQEVHIGEVFFDGTTQINKLTEAEAKRNASDTVNNELEGRAPGSEPIKACK